MKGGFAMGLLAVAALRRAAPDAIRGELGFLSVIEEECTGNGTLAACRAGVRVAAAHADVHGEPPWQMVLGSTTDARYYLNQFGVPALAYGPRSRNIHGNDEAVELASIVSGARALARFIADFFAGGGR